MDLKNRNCGRLFKIIEWNNENLYDSSGVRFAAGQQATMLNKIMTEIFKDQVINQKKLHV